MSDGSQDCPILHVDMDAFYASVAIRDRPDLQQVPVIVGGGHRGVVLSANYPARAFGIRSGMSGRQAHDLCPQAVRVSADFGDFETVSRSVMEIFREVTPLVEPLSLDEAFVDLAPSGLASYDDESVRALAEDVRARVREVTGGLTASVGIGTSKFIAKVASDLDKPDGLVIVSAGSEQDLLRPMHVTVIPGVGPATSERLRRAGISTVADLESVS